ncbi:hypothetical protein CPTAKMNP4_180 [Salmonella phage vB_SenM-AKM_NP4]|uniref:Uncharacterized protein n=2 Tax=Gelderlandvirus TaxID=1913653 RepID=M1HNV9_BPS16|nr:hypothetical protein I133_gp091 [Salmonella phage vB_SenM-S16]YP_009126382.1 hypothetical protein STP4a_175 [Salmonella phage STP4-a]WDR21841.1 hypothetical protein PJM34_0173 [Salmonella phage vB_SenM_UTK0003]WKV23528.1 hypothetical protein SEA1_gp0180 [Salmonella phage SEA1]WLI71802.1 hypothetical protein CPTAKMNP4_180 [Salmonella phage vB_SenM-AKM_NP4]AGE48197.1 hypothetical protein [Salmonella phage vB_SenM-S16]AHJ87029.1 hypothetical protein STP4a_175 [Salmonella phage STP4-a]
MEIKILRGPSGRILTKSMVKNGTINALKAMYTWCIDKPSALVYCYENNSIQPNCKFCGEGLNSPINSYCNPRCQMKHLGGFPKDCNVGKTPWNKGLKDNSRHCSIVNPEKWEAAKHKISKANSGENNGMYGWDNEDQRRRQSETIKAKILSGEFTPNTNNRRTSFDVVYDGKNYRSSWEAAYASINKTAVHERIRVPYIGNDLKKHIYISDFLNPETNEIVEIRPASLYDDNHPKIVAIKKYCDSNGYKYTHIDIEYFYANRHLIDYDGLGDDTSRKITNAIKKYKRNKKT